MKIVQISFLILLNAIFSNNIVLAQVIKFNSDLVLENIMDIMKLNIEYPGECKTKLQQKEYLHSAEGKIDCQNSDHSPV